MKLEFGVTIATDLSVEDVQGLSGFPHFYVVDLRMLPDGTAKPIAEPVLKRLKNFHVDYHQMPMDLDNATSRQENDLLRTMTDQPGNILVLADKMVPVARFCQELDIPFLSRDLYLVENGRGITPAQINTQINNVLPFEKIAV